LREGLVFAGLVRGRPPGQSPPNRRKSWGVNVTNNAGVYLVGRGSRRGWNREGAASPAGKPAAKTGPGAQERSPCPPRSPDAFGFHLHLHLHTPFRRASGPGDALLPARSRVGIRSHAAALRGNRRRPGTLYRFAELHPAGFDLLRVRQDPPTEALRTKPIPGLRDRFSRREPHAPRPTKRIPPWKQKPWLRGFTSTFTCPSASPRP